MPKKVEDFIKEAQEGKGLTQEESQLISSVNDKAVEVGQYIRADGNDEIANTLGEYFNVVALMTSDPAESLTDMQRELWQSHSDSMATFDDFLNDNFDTIMKGGMKWNPPAFGNNGKDFFDWLSVINTKLGVSLEKTQANHPEIQNPELAAQKMDVWRPPVPNINMQQHEDHPRQVLDAFGPNAKQKDFYADKEAMDAIQFNEAKEAGFSDRFVTAVILGGTYNPANIQIDQQLNASQEDLLHFAQSNLTSNVAQGDRRFAHFSHSLLSGRQEAKDAFVEYQKKNYEPLKTILGRFLKKAARGATETNFNQVMGNHEIEREEIQLAKDILEADLPFDVKELVTEGELVHLKAGIAMNEANVDRDQRIYDFIKNPPAPGSPEREAALSEIFMDIYIGQTSATKTDKMLNEGIKRLDDLLAEKGITDINANTPEDQLQDDETGTDYDLILNGKEKLFNASSWYRDALGQFTFTGQEVTIGMEGGREALKEAYLDQIKETRAFQNLMNENDPAKLVTLFAEGISSVGKKGAQEGGFDSLEQEALPGDKEAARLTEQSKPEVDKRYQRTDDIVNESSAQHLKRNETVSNLKDWTKELNSKRFGLFNNSSGEMDLLREKTANVIKVLGSNFKEGARLDSPEAKQALRELKEAAAEYIRKKQLPHGKVGDEKWEPGTPMGRDRFRAAKKINQLMDDLLGESWKKGIAEFENAPANAKENEADELDQAGGGIEDEPEEEKDLEVDNLDNNIENEAGEKLYELENRDDFKIPGSLSGTRDDLKNLMNEGKPEDFAAFRGRFQVHIATILAIKTLWPQEEKNLNEVYKEEGYDTYKKKSDELIEKKGQISTIRNNILDNRQDFKMMMDDVKTWEDAKKLTDMAIAPDAKQLVNHMATYRVQEKKLNGNRKEGIQPHEPELDQPVLQEGELLKKAGGMGPNNF